METAPFPWEFFFGFFFLALTLGIAHTVGLIAALVSLLRREDPQVTGDSRLIWVLIIVFVPFGWIVYFLIGRR